jgi:LysR family nitrogen assimilation transcriptional regulator
MDFNTLRQFVTIAEQESLSRAAEILNLTQGTLSRRLAELERELGAHLFTRTGRGVVPTTAGRQLLDHARKMLLNHQSAVDAVRGLRDPEAGRITVGMPPSLCELLTVPLYEKFRSRFPKASLSIVQGLSEELYLHILSNRIDLAIMRNPPVSPNVAIELLAKEPLGLLGRKPVGLRRDRVTLAQLAQIPLILPYVPDVTQPRVLVTR